MFPRNRILIAFMFWAALPVVVMEAGALGGLSGGGDEVAAYLQRHGLKQLLTVHLEQQLIDAKGELKEELIRQLADLYAELLESEQLPQKRDRLEVRARELVSSLPQHDAGSLRLALLRGSYRVAEKIAENHRLRLASDEEADEARRILTDILPRFSQLRRQLKDRLDILERQLSRANVAGTVRLNSDVDQARDLYDECTFYNAWGLYYQSWMHDRPDNASVAQELFASLLGAGTSHPSPNEISVDLRSVEAIARSILGFALCKSLTASAPTAVNWIELIKAENTFETLRNEAPIWHMVILMEHADFAGVQDVLNDYLSTGKPLPLSWLRMIAVHALERPAHDRRAAVLARYAVTELASRDQLDQVLDLAQRYGTESLGDTGFALRYVRGVISYSDARAAHNSESPAFDPDVVAMFDRAAKDLDSALLESDVNQYADAAAACRRLIGYCRYFAGRFLDARIAFEEAATSLPQAEDAAEALWMAIVSLDNVVQAGGSERLKTQLDDIMTRFLREHPSSEYAPRIVLKRSISRGIVSVEAVESLLSIPENSEVYDSARIRAAQMLYELFRQSSGERKIGHAVTFIALAMPVQSRAMNENDAGDVSVRAELINRCRMLLEVTLTEGVSRLVAARQTLSWIDELASQYGDDLLPYQDEITYRRVLERLFSEQEEAAGGLADELWNRNELSIWSRLASRAMFRHAHRRWQDAASSLVVELATLQQVERYGGRILLESAGESGALSDPVVLTYHAAVAEAVILIWERTGEERKARAAMVIYDKLLNEKPNTYKFLRAAAILAERLGRTERSLECWRHILSGSEIRSLQWFEAKFHQITLLAQIDSHRARRVLDQHILLNPDYGPDPWGARLKGLDEDDRLPPSQTGNGGGMP